MKIDIMTLFPEMINAVMRESIIGRAQDKGVVEVKATNIRDYALDKHHKADDAPYGGGRGQVMLAEPLYLCHQALSAGEHVHTVFLSAQGQPFNQQKARELLAKEHFILRTRYAAWCRAFCRTRKRSRRKATGTACSSIRSTPVRKTGAAEKCRRCCSPGTMPILKHGDAK